MCLVVAVGLMVVGSGAGAQGEVGMSVPVVRAKRLAIHYDVAGVVRGEISRVELWYGRGESGPWQLYAYDEDRVSPVEFMAGEEGVYRFLVVAVDQWGRRSYGREGEELGVRPQQVVFVDYTAPKLYLYSPVGQDQRVREELKIRWAGFDDQARAYPVELFARPASETTWTRIAESLPMEGEYTWVVPERFEGEVRVKVAMRDRAGNVSEEVAPPVQIVWSRDEGREGDPVSEGAEEAVLTHEQRQALEQWVRRGNLHSERGEWGQAVEAYRAALEVDGSDAAAGVNLANALFRQGRTESAQQQYERCLRLHPDRPSALFGLAQSQISLDQPSLARETLKRLLAQDDRDWQGWLLYGNVSAELGDRDEAFRGWQRAANDVSPVRSLALEQLRRHRP